MKVLLDTNALLWIAEDSPRLSSRAREIIEDPATDVLYSVTSVWEITIKVTSGRFDLGEPLAQWLAKVDSVLTGQIPVDIDHVLRLSDLPRLHGDPFDRMIVSQAMALDVPLISSDHFLRSYDVEVIW